jgi:hypothetical protein
MRSLVKPHSSPSPSPLPSREGNKRGENLPSPKVGALGKGVEILQPSPLEGEGEGEGALLMNSLVIHKFQTTLPGIRRDIVFERIFLSDIPTACIYEFKRQKPSESRRTAGTRMSENAIFCFILTIVYE